MNLKELDSFKISDAIGFHDELNPELWQDDHLIPEVKEQLELIAQDFLDELGVSDLDVKDITVSGSNAAYSYTPHSDLDLHILVDMSNFPDSDIYFELFNAKKNLYNDSHEITVHGVPVELYVQDANEPVVSLGEYSIMNDKWIRTPTKRRANFDQNATRAKYEKLRDLIVQGLKSHDVDKIDELIKKVKQYRQAGLDQGGEFSPENLAYKALRSEGLVDKMYNLRNKLHSRSLSIEEDVSPKLVYHVTPTRNLRFISKNGLVPKVGDRSMQLSEKPAIFCFPDKASVEDAMMNWLGDQFDEDEQLALLKIDTTGLQGKYTPGAEYEIVFTDRIPPDRIKLVTKDLDNYELTEDDTLQYASEKTPAVNPYGGLKDNQFRGDISEASGYIPSEKEKNDPRFKTALTVDVKPDSIKKNAKAFGFKTSRAGIPPTLRP